MGVFQSYRQSYCCNSSVLYSLYGRLEFFDFLSKRSDADKCKLSLYSEDEIILVVKSKRHRPLCCLDYIKFSEHRNDMDIEQSRHCQVENNDDQACTVHVTLSLLTQFCLIRGCSQPWARVDLCCVFQNEVCELPWNAASMIVRLGLFGFP